MAIAGIKPVDYAYWLANNTEYYDKEKVREILVEFGMRWVPLNYGESEERQFEFMGNLVDEFMESNGEE